jgi:hypothetical protein
MRRGLPSAFCWPPAFCPPSAGCLPSALCLPSIFGGGAISVFIVIVRGGHHAAARSPSRPHAASPSRASIGSALAALRHPLFITQSTTHTATEKIHRFREKALAPCILPSRNSLETLAPDSRPVVSIVYRK